MGQPQCNACNIVSRDPVVSQIPGFGNFCPICVQKIICRNCGLHFCKLRKILFDHPEISALPNIGAVSDEIFAYLQDEVFGLPVDELCFRAHQVANEDGSKGQDVAPFRESDSLVDLGFLFREEEQEADSEPDCRRGVLMGVLDFILNRESPFRIPVDEMHANLEASDDEVLFFAADEIVGSLFSMVSRKDFRALPGLKVLVGNQCDSSLQNSMQTEATDDSGRFVLCKWCLENWTSWKIAEIRQRTLRSLEEEEEMVTCDDDVLLDTIGEDAFGEILSFMVFPSGVLRLSLVCKRWHCFLRGNNLGWLRCIVLTSYGQIPSIARLPKDDQDVCFPDRWDEEELATPKVFRSRGVRDAFGLVSPGTVTSDPSRFRLLSDFELWEFVFHLFRCFRRRPRFHAYCFPNLHDIVFADHRVNNVTDVGLLVLVSLLKGASGFQTVGFEECGGSRFATHRLGLCASSTKPRAVYIVQDLASCLMRVPSLKSVSRLTFDGPRTSPFGRVDLLRRIGWNVELLVFLRVLKFRGVKLATLQSFFKACGTYLGGLEELYIQETALWTGVTPEFLGETEFPAMISLRVLHLFDSRFLGVKMWDNNDLLHLARQSVLRSVHIQLLDNEDFMFDVRNFVKNAPYLRYFSLKSRCIHSLDLVDLNLSRLRGLLLVGLHLVSRSIDQLQHASELRYLVVDGLKFETNHVSLFFDKLRHLRLFSLLGVQLDWVDIFNRLTSSPSKLRSLALCDTQVGTPLLQMIVNTLTRLRDITFQVYVYPPHLIRFIERCSSLRRIVIPVRESRGKVDLHHEAISRICASRGIVLQEIPSPKSLNSMW